MDNQNDNTNAAHDLAPRDYASQSLITSSNSLTPAQIAAAYYEVHGDFDVYSLDVSSQAGPNGFEHEYAAPLEERLGLELNRTFPFIRGEPESAESIGNEASYFTSDIN